jgi:hypothetical protein
LFGIVHSLSGLLAEEGALDVVEFVAPVQPNALTAPRRPMTLNNLVHVCMTELLTCRAEARKGEGGP